MPKQRRWFPRPAGHQRWGRSHPEQLSLSSNGNHSNCFQRNWTSGKLRQERDVYRKRTAGSAFASPWRSAGFQTGLTYAQVAACPPCHPPALNRSANRRFGRVPKTRDVPHRGTCSNLRQERHVSGLKHGHVTSVPLLTELVWGRGGWCYRQGAASGAVPPGAAPQALRFESEISKEVVAKIGPNAARNWNLVWRVSGSELLAPWERGYWMNPACRLA